MRKLLDEAQVIDEQGPPTDAGTLLEAEYVYPFQAHGCMEPMNALAHYQRHVDGDRVELWLGTQGATPLRDRIAALWKLPPEHVVVHPQYSGGGFGRRSHPDVAIEALRISQAAGGVPVQVLWTREDDLRHDHFHPYSLGRFASRVSADGRLLSMRHTESRSYWGDAGNEVPWLGYECGHWRYAFSNAQSASPLQGGAWRAVVANAWAFGQESFVDEVAHQLGRDPLKLRQDWLRRAGDRPAGRRYTVNAARLRRVLETLAGMIDWSEPPPPVPGARVGRGMALYPYLHGDSYGALALEVAVFGPGQVRVTRAVMALDCGRVVNPSGARQQAEGGLAWGLGAALHGGVRLEGGAARIEGFHEAPVLRMHEMPARVDVSFVDDVKDAPTGLGELVPPLVAPSLANAIFAATGQRLRRLPLLPT